jgi:hypothetical protein
MAMVQVLNGLLKADGDEDAEHDDEEVDEEVALRHRGVLRRVDVDHVGSRVEGRLRPVRWLE